MDPAGAQRRAAYGAILSVWLRGIRITAPSLVMLVAVIVALVASFSEPRWVVPVAQFCTVACMVCLWAGFFAAVQRQNHPLTARLLPAQLRRLRELAVLGLLVTALPSAGLLAYSPLQIPGPAALILSMLACVGLAVIVRWPWIWIVGWVVVSLAGAAVSGPMRLAVRARVVESYTHQPVSMTAVVFVLSALALWHLFQAGGPGHVKSWRSDSQVRDLLKSSGEQAAIAPSLEGRLAILLDWVGQAFAWLRNVYLDVLIRRARPSVHSVMARVELASNPRTHWAATIGALLLTSGAMGAGLFVLLLVTPDGAELGGSMALAFAFSYLGMLVNPLIAAPGAVLRGRREQSVLVLLPGVPRGPALNRQLAGRQMGAHVVNWTLALAFMGGMQALASHLKGADMSLSLLGRAAVSLALLVLPMGLLQWRNWSVERETRPAWTLLLTMLLLVGTVSLTVVIGERPALMPVPLIGGSVLVTAVLAALRWPSISRYPSFWPVGRHA